LIATKNNNSKVGCALRKCVQTAACFGAFVEEEKLIIAKRIKAIQSLRTSGVKDMSNVHVEIFFTVFVSEQITRQELNNKIPNVSEATIKRYVADLIHDHLLINERECDKDCRLKYLYITEKGARLIQVEVGKIKECIDLL